MACNVILGAYWRIGKWLVSFSQNMSSRPAAFFKFFTAAAGAGTVAADPGRFLDGVVLYITVNIVPPILFFYETADFMQDNGFSTGYGGRLELHRAISVCFTTFLGFYDFQLLPVRYFFNVYGFGHCQRMPGFDKVWHLFYNICRIP